MTREMALQLVAVQVASTQVEYYRDAIEELESVVSVNPDPRAQKALELGRMFHKKWQEALEALS